MNRYYFFALVTAGLFFAFFSCKTSSSEELAIRDPDALDAILNKYVDNGLYPFLYARLENKEGELLYEHSAVNEALLPNTKVDGGTWIRIWSMSKIVTISLALDLVEDGILNLNDPVMKYIPEFENLKVAVLEDGTPISKVDRNDAEGACPFRLAPNDSVMTVLHLINHQAGFYYSTTGFPCLDSMQAEKNLPGAENSQELISRLAELPLIQHSGTQHYYGTNTTVLGLVAERASGKSLKELVEERVTGPMKIDELQYGLPGAATLLPRVSGRDSVLRIAQPGELDIFGQDLPDYDPTHELYLGGEGMLATADGYADFLRMLLNGGALNGHRFLDRPTVEDIHAPHTQLDSPYGYNGYNLWVSSDSMRARGHGEAGLWIGGGYEGTHFWVDPKREFVGVVMTQMFWVQPEGYGKDDEFRGAIYQQFWEKENKVK